MTADKKFKKEVRARMARTGESYMVAREALLLGRPEPVRREDLPRYGSRDQNEPTPE